MRKQCKNIEKTNQKTNQKTATKTNSENWTKSIEDSEKTCRKQVENAEKTVRKQFENIEKTNQKTAPKTISENGTKSIEVCICVATQGKQPTGYRKFEAWNDIITSVFMVKEEEHSDQPCPDCDENPGRLVCNCKTFRHSGFCEHILAVRVFRGELDLEYMLGALGGGRKTRKPGGYRSGVRPCLERETDPPRRRKKSGGRCKLCMRKTTKTGKNTHRRHDQIPETRISIMQTYGENMCECS